MKKKSVAVVPAGVLKMSLEQLRGVQGLRSSGAAGQHDSRPNRARTRGASKSRAVRESFES